MNTKEQQEQTLYYDYGFRQYDAQLGRWHVVDALAEKYLSTSPYAYVMNDPINHTDIAGLYRGGGNQWISYPRPYLDSNSSRVGGEGMNFRNNMTGTILGLNSAHKNMMGVGPTRKDHDDWVAAGKPFGDFGIWHKKQNDAAWKAGFKSRQEALANHYTFYSKRIKKWRKKTEELSYNYGLKDDKVDVAVSEVIIINEAYYETEYYCYASESYSDSGINWRYKGQRLSHEETKKFLKEWGDMLTNRGYQAGITSTVVYAIKTVPKGIAIFNTLNITTEYYVKQKLFNEVSNNYDNKLGISIETWTTQNGTFSFPITVSYIKLNSTGKTIGIIWQ